MRNVSDKRCRENRNTHVIFSSFFFFFFENHAVCEIILKNMIEPDRTKLSSMRFACLITKATNTHSGYVIFVAFSRQQWLRKSASKYFICILPVLSYMYLFIYSLFSFFSISYLFPARIFFCVCTRPDARLTMVQLLVYSAFNRAYFFYDILNPNSRRKTTTHFL
jgi:hypothetical protein